MTGQPAHPTRSRLSRVHRSWRPWVIFIGLAAVSFLVSVLLRFSLAVDPILSPDVLPVSLINKAEQQVIIEVVFKQAVNPDDLRMVVGLSKHSPPSESAVSSSLIKILRRYGLQGVERCFRSLDNVDCPPCEGDPEDSAMKYGRENFIRFYFPHDKDAAQIYKALRQLPEVVAAVPVPKAIPATSPMDEPKLGGADQILPSETQWYIFRCRAERAWDAGRTGDRVVIADIDFGFCVDHEELRSRIELKYNSMNHTENVSQGGNTYHGTAVLGLAGADVNGTGIAGFAFGASLWAIQAAVGTGSAPGAWADAIDFVRLHDAGNRRKVIILEQQTDRLGNYEMVPSVRKAIVDSICCNIVVCVAAGNGDRDVGISDICETIPETGSILVGATSYDAMQNRNPRWDYSNYGSRMAVSAPGDPRYDLTCGCISSCCFPVRPYTKHFGGTSGATAKVAGAVALMLEANPRLSPRDVKEILKNTGPDVVTGLSRPMGKFLDVEAAVGEALRRATEEGN